MIAEFELEFHARLVLENALRETPGKLTLAAGHLARAQLLARHLGNKALNYRLVLENIAVSGLTVGMARLDHFFTQSRADCFISLNSALTGEYLGRMVEYHHARGDSESAIALTALLRPFADQERPAKQSAHYIESFGLAMDMRDYEGAAGNLQIVNDLLTIEPHDYYRMLYYERLAHLQMETGDTLRAQESLLQAHSIQTTRQLVSRSSRSLNQRLDEVLRSEGLAIWT